MLFYRNPVIATDGGEIVWIDAADARVLSRAKHEGECVEKLLSVGDSHLIAQLFASETLL